MSDEPDLPQTEILDSRLPQTDLLPERAPTEILPDRPPAHEQPHIINQPDAADDGGDSDTSSLSMAELTRPLPLEELAPTAILDEPAPRPPTSPAPTSPPRAPRATPLINPAISHPAISPLGSLYPTPAPVADATARRASGAPPQRPGSVSPRHAPESSGVVRAYWQRVKQPWRTQAETPELRQLALRRCLDIVPDVEHGDYPFLDVEPKLDRDDIEWLLAHHESAGAAGPVDWSNENQRARRGLDLRGADLRGVDLSGLPLARARFGLSHTEWQRSTPDQRERAAAHLEGANLEGASLEHATLVGAHLEQARCVGAVLEGADLRFAHLARADFLEARLAEADLRNADLTETDLWKATLDRADLTQARLPKAVLREASLDHTTLTQAQLQGADCIKAHLHYAILT
ncbi:MAG TPA: pentapeptide repeat-containing protein, partial [Ktedonobacterales bacterium]|nr:pentapeptide repeat-containing protein [Ktedonobacterales bacterium]